MSEIQKGFAMGTLPALDVAIGLSFVFLLLSLVCTTLNEMVAGVFKTRSKFLKEGIQNLIGDKDLSEKVLAHPLVQSLSRQGEKGSPSYIPAGVFSTALMDQLTGPGNSSRDLELLQVGVRALTNAHARLAMQPLLDGVNSDSSEVKRRIEAWFNDGMDRVSGWYKRHTQINGIILAVMVTLGMNVDAIHIIDVLWTQPTLRLAVVEQAKMRSIQEQNLSNAPMVEYQQPDDPTASKPINLPAGDALSDKDKQLLGEFTGWSSDWAQRSTHGGLGSWLAWIIWNHLLGWLVSIVALSLGAPFWFDTLNRFMNLRNSGKPPEVPKPDKACPAPAR